MTEERLEKATAKIEYEGDLWAYYGHPIDGYSVSFGWEYDPLEGRKIYYATFHKGDMPAFNTETFDGAQALAARILELQPDMRRWRRTNLEA